MKVARSSGRLYLRLRATDEADIYEYLWYLFDGPLLILTEAELDSARVLRFAVHAGGHA